MPGVNHCRTAPSPRACVFALILPLLTTSCVLVPVPAFSEPATSGQPIYRDQINTLTPGQTTRSDIHDILGYPSFSLEDHSAGAYVWEKPTAHLLKFLVIPFPRYPIVLDAGSETATAEFVFFVLYDDSDRAVAFERKRLSERQEPRKEFDNWVKVTRQNLGI